MGPRPPSTNSLKSTDRSRRHHPALCRTAIPGRRRRALGDHLVCRRVRSRHRRRADCHGRQSNWACGACHLPAACSTWPTNIPETRAARAGSRLPLSVSLMLHVADTDTALARARDRGATRRARAVRELRFAQRRHHRPVRAPLDAVRSKTRCGHPHPARRRGLRIGVDTRRRSGGDVLRPRARLGLRSGHPPGDQHPAAHRHLRGWRSKDAVLLLCGDRPRRRAPARSPRRAGSRARFRSSSSGPCSMPPTRRAAPSPSSTRRRARRAPSSMALGRANFRTSPTRCRMRPHSATFFSGLLFWTFEPGRVEDGWQVESTHPMAGVAGGAGAPTTVPMWTVADVDAAVAGCGRPAVPCSRSRRGSPTG